MDSDQYNTAGADVQEYILTSMLKRVDVAVYTTITNFLNEGNQSGVLVFDLAADGVGYSQTGGFVDEFAPQLDDLRALIVTGQLVVPQVIGGGA